MRYPNHTVGQGAVTKSLGSKQTLVPHLGLKVEEVEPLRCWRDQRASLGEEAWPFSWEGEAWVGHLTAVVAVAGIWPDGS